MKRAFLKWVLLAVIAASTLNAYSANATAAGATTPVTPNASPEARTLLNFIHALIRAYNHDLILTRDELPNIMDYLKDGGGAVPAKSDVSGGQVSVQSPDGTIEVTIRGNGPLTYSVSVDGKAVLADSRLGLRFKDGVILGASSRLISADRSGSDRRRPRTLGQRRHEALLPQSRSSQRQGRRADLPSAGRSEELALTRGRDLERWTTMANPTRGGDCTIPPDRLYYRADYGYDPKRTDLHHDQRAPVR